MKTVSRKTSTGKIRSPRTPAPTPPELDMAALDAANERLYAAFVETRRLPIEKGDLIALREAMGRRMFDLRVHPSRDRVSVETWLFEAMARALDAAILGKLKRGTGKATPQARLDRELTDFVRGVAVQRARASGLKGDAAFVLASENIRGTPFAGEGEAVKKSYLRVRERLPALG